MAKTVIALLFSFIVLIVSTPIPDSTIEPDSALNQDTSESFEPYEFGYQFGDESGMVQHRQESADGTGRVKGSYSYRDELGVFRTVEYIADGDGYRATIKSNEPGLSNQNSADVSFFVEPPPPAVVAQQLLKKEGDDLSVGNALSEVNDKP